MAKSPKRQPLTDTGGLFGPDIADAFHEHVDKHGTRVIDAKDPVGIEAWQFVNRWVFFEHHRPAALKELRALLKRAGGK